MIINELLNEKYQAQEKIDNESNHQLNDYIIKTHSIVENLKKEFKIKFNYVSINNTR